eukprot:CAMPEP_0198224430 /NCGR_PEP_ID=MMETSP1445-20131203/96935_1 /TAXON_ID=36898 /ORGANISM="Pyramimonas sp., Strain CCMP2087" /LENGTH=57 /DNA_ID=CAMNT_0043903607 /DNA_START=79 /DNA_END=249 /DNA_ORIENTATION=+
MAAMVIHLQALIQAVAFACDLVQQIRPPPRLLLLTIFHLVLKLLALLLAHLARVGRG